MNLINLIISVSSMASMSPNNFSWVEPGKLAGLALPRMTCEYQYLLDNGIKHLVCLCERKPPYHDSCPELQLHHIKIADFTPPSPSQIDRFLSIVEEANSKGEVRAQMLDRLWLTNGPAYKSARRTLEVESFIVHKLTNRRHCNLIHLAANLLDSGKKKKKSWNSWEGKTVFHNLAAPPKCMNQKATGIKSLCQCVEFHAMYYIYSCLIAGFYRLACFYLVSAFFKQLDRVGVLGCAQ